MSDPSQLIDEDQWTGEDFFIVWPMPGYIFVMQRVVEVFQAANVKSCRIRKLESGLRGESFSGTDSFRTESLAVFLPVDLAIKYGKPLGIV